MILVDTSGLLAALFPDQRGHEACAEALRGSTARLLSPFVLAELDSLVLKLAGVETERRLLDEVARGAYELETFTASDVARANEIVRRHKALKLGLADASIVVLAERYGVIDILTLDQRHFRSLRVGRRSFRLLPADR